MKKCKTRTKANFFQIFAQLVVCVKRVMIDHYRWWPFAPLVISVYRPVDNCREIVSSLEKWLPAEIYVLGHQDD